MIKRYARLTRRTGIRRVSSRRARELRIYRRAVYVFLLAHPFCQVYLKENNLSEAEAIANKGCHFVRRQGDGLTWIEALDIPFATQVHHMNKRRGARLLDESEWLAVCKAAHDRIEGNKSWARAAGFLRNF
jgi:hypothetical protein